MIDVELLHRCSRNSIVAQDSADRDLALRLGWREELLGHLPELRPHPRMLTGHALAGEFESGPKVVHPKQLDEPRSGPWMAIGRGSPFDYPTGHAGRFSVPLVASSPTYIADLWRQMAANDIAVLGWLRAITPAHTLVCDCSLERCHGEVVVRAWRWLWNQDRAHAQLRMLPGDRPR